MTLPEDRPARPAPRLLGALVMLAVAAVGRPLLAQNDGNLDPRWAGNGIVRMSRNTSTEELPAAIACAPGNFAYISFPELAGGPPPDLEFTTVGISVSGDLTAMVRGSVNFQLGGSNDDIPYAVAIQADGKPVLVGPAVDSSTAGNQYQAAIARFHVGSPTLDSSFSGDGKANVDFVGNAYPEAVAIDPNGYVVVAGCYLTGGVAGTDIFVLRFDSSGILDPGFDGNGIRTFGFDSGSANNDCAYAVAVQSDGKIVVAGSAQYPDNGSGFQDYDFAVARLNTNGSLDGTFSGDGKVTVGFDVGAEPTDLGSAVAIDHLGRIVVGGLAQINSVQTVSALTRLTPSGAIDSSFGSLGRFTGATGSVDVYGLGIASPPSNRLLYLDGAEIAALSDLGQVDTSFSGDGLVPFNDPDGTSERPLHMAFCSGMPYVLGTSHSTEDDFIVARYFMRQIFGDDFESGNIRAFSAASQ